MEVPSLMPCFIGKRPVIQSVFAMKRTKLHDRIADEAIGKADEEFIRHVRRGENLIEWYQHLIELKMDVETQIAERKAKLDTEHTRCLSMGDAGKQIWFEAKDEFQTWKVGAVRFKNALEYRLGEVKKLKREARQRIISDRAALLDLAAEMITDIGAGAEWHRHYRRLKGKS